MRISCKCDLLVGTGSRGAPTWQVTVEGCGAVCGGYRFFAARPRRSGAPANGVPAHGLGRSGTVPATSGSLLVAGTTSDAGKSVITAGICRWLARQGVRVAPFKAQNMSNNSLVAPDAAEIGRAPAMQ